MVLLLAAVLDCLLLSQVPSYFHSHNTNGHRPPSLSNRRSSAVRSPRGRHKGNFKSRTMLGARDGVAAELNAGHVVPKVVGFVGAKEEGEEEEAVGLFGAEEEVRGAVEGVGGGGGNVGAGVVSAGTDVSGRVITGEGVICKKARKEAEKVEVNSILRIMLL